MTQKPKNRHARRAVFISVLFILWLMAIGGRAAYLQLYRGTWLSQQAADQYEQQLTIQGKRGTVFDALHNVMAVSIETTSVAAYPMLITEKPQAAMKLAKALGMNKKEIQEKLNKRQSFVWLKRQATPKETEAVKKLNLDGVDFLTEHSRFYPNTTLAGQVLGFTGIDGHGLEGMEFYYDQELKGSQITFTVLKDALGRGFKAEVQSQSATDQAGNNLILTIDRHIQFITEQALADAVTQYQARSGIAIVMEPQTGAIKALAHYPVFNPNNFRQYQREAWRNRALTDPYEPGSTMKIFSAAAALQSGRSKPDTIYYCENGSYRVGPHMVNDTKPHSWLSLQQIVKYSSNIGAVKIVENIGSQTLYQSLKGFGFGERTQIDCPGESNGALSYYKSWTVVDSGAIAFGQGMSVTALQLITAASALANDGLLMRPYLVQAITDANGQPIRKIEPMPQRQVVSPEVARTIRRIMRSVVTAGGTGTEADLSGYSVCGKTGTAQKIGNDGKYAPNRYVASFLGFAPTEQPVLSILVVVDEPKEVIYGGSVAAPAFKRIVKESMSYLNIAPYDTMQRLRVSRDVRHNG
jgi:cell division protein FtsI (penicillin-binding protein 3)